MRIADAPLPSISSMVRRDFNRAVGNWHSKYERTAANFTTRYRLLVPYSERTDDDVARLVQEKWREVGAALLGSTRRSWLVVVVFERV